MCGAPADVPSTSTSAVEDWDDWEPGSGHVTHLAAQRSGDLHEEDRLPPKPFSDRTYPETVSSDTAITDKGKQQQQQQQCGCISRRRGSNSQALPDVIQPAGALQGRQPFVIRHRHRRGDVYKTKCCSGIRLHFWSSDMNQPQQTDLRGQLMALRVILVKL